MSNSQQQKGSSNRKTGMGPVEQRRMALDDTGLAVTVARQPRQQKPLDQFGRKVMAVIKSQAEQSYFDVHSSGAVGVDFSGTITALTEIAQGNTDSNRTGDMVTPSSILLKGQVVAGDATNLLRVMLFRWKPNTTLTTAPSVPQILQLQAVADAPLSPVYQDYKRGDQFEVLWDKLFSLDTYNPTDSFSFRINLPSSRPICYTAGGTNGSDKFYLLYISDSGAAPNPSIQFWSRFLYYEDF